MTFDWLIFQGPALALSTGALLSALVLGVGALLLIASHIAFPSEQRGEILLLLLASLPVAVIAVVRFTPQMVGVPLLLMVPIFASALRHGPGIAGLSGLIVGAIWWLSGSVPPAFIGILGLVGWSAGWLATQRFAGQTAALLRQPLVFSVGSALIVGWPLAVIATIFNTPDQFIRMVDRGIAAVPGLFILFGLTALIGGGFLQIMSSVTSVQVKPPADDLTLPPWERRLDQRTLWIVIPMVLVSVVALASAITSTSYGLATRLVINQIERDAENAGDGIPFFVQVGRGIIRDLATSPTLVESDPAAIEDDLAEGVRIVPFFEQVLYVDTQGHVMATFPADSSLTPLEQSRIETVLTTGSPTEFIVEPEAAGEAAVMVFVASVQASDGTVSGALVGRSQLSSNPILEPVANLLVDGIVGEGEGFILGENGDILLYPAAPARQGESFTLGQVTRTVGGPREGQAYRRVQPDGTRDLVYVLPVEGQSNWSIVMTVPNDVALQLAGQIALPTLGLLLLINAIAIPLALIVVRRITRPLEDLLESVESIGRGDLSDPIETKGQAEIRRLSQGVEEMRRRLQRRLDEQDNLLRVSRATASNLELFRAMPPILSSAIGATDADGVRVVLHGDDEYEAYASGPIAPIMAALDERIFKQAEQQGMLVVSQLWRATNLIQDLEVSTRLQSLVAFPLRSDTAYHGVMWLGFQDEHAFDDAEMTFLSTLAGQTAVAIANSRLFTETQQRRRDLEAVLASTVDGIIVTDVNGRISLINPAAAEFLNMRAEQVRGEPVKEAVTVDLLGETLADLQAPASDFEIPGPDNRTLLATCSTIVNDGTIAGRVGVLRDVTDIKELDNIKTVFLRMVSHDLRSPLTYMRGYITMMPLLGDLNAKQNESIDKIQTGINHISQMTERLTHLSRLRFGESFELDYGMIDILSVVKDVADEQRSAAAEGDVSIHIEAEDDLPLLIADPVLFRQAVLNLVGNAVKYSPDGGDVHIRVRRIPFDDNHEGVTVTIQDQGVGIRKEDQEQLFKAFYRVPHREGDPPRPSGSGLGLALVKSITDAHGGHVAVESEHGVGSAFSITIPLLEVGDIEALQSYEH